MSTWTVDGSDVWPVPSIHARSRYASRSTEPELGVFDAWSDAEVVEILEEAPVPRGDEFRYDAQGDTVICRRESSLTTCYGLAPEHLTNIHGVAVAAAVDAQYGTDYRSGIDAANLEDVNR